MSDLAWWLRNFQETAFRLETLVAYSVPQEVELLERFRRGEQVRLPDDHSWLQLVRNHTAAGKRMQRVRVVSQPLTEYLRFELSIYPQCVAAGEDIRVADYTPDLKALGDFWIFDNSTVVLLHYDTNGRFLKTAETSHSRYLEQAEYSLTCSTELSAYLTRTTRV